MIRKGFDYSQKPGPGLFLTLCAGFAAICEAGTHGLKQLIEYERIRGNVVALRVNIKKNEILLFIFGMAAVLLSLSSDAFSGNPLSSANFMDIKEKKTAPDFILKDLEDTPTRLSALKGKVVLLYFWTTW
jgi:hypothetical protein